MGASDQFDAARAQLTEAMAAAKRDDAVATSRLEHDSIDLERLTMRMNRDRDTRERSADIIARASGALEALDPARPKHTNAPCTTNPFLTVMDMELANSSRVMNAAEARAAYDLPPESEPEQEAIDRSEARANRLKVNLEVLEQPNRAYEVTGIRRVRLTGDADVRIREVPRVGGEVEYGFSLEGAFEGVLSRATSHRAQLEVTRDVLLAFTDAIARKLNTMEDHDGRH